jgi:glutaminyl-tRNA synthetase
VHRSREDAAGNVTEVHCTYDPATRGGDSPDGRKVKSTIHWVSARHAVDAEVRLYDHLFRTADPEDVPPGQDWKANLNPNSLEVLPDAKVEPSLADARRGRSSSSSASGISAVDPDSKPGKPVFNRAVSLKDSWAKEAQKGPQPAKK